MGWPSCAPEGTPRCAIRTRSFQCQRIGRETDLLTMNTYCAQCWSHHTRVNYWPGLDDSWPTAWFMENDGTFVGADDNGKKFEMRPRCKWYAFGRCKFGDGCWFSHDDSPGDAKKIKSTVDVVPPDIVQQYA